MANQRDTARERAGIAGRLNARSVVVRPLSNFLYIGRLLLTISVADALNTLQKRVRRYLREKRLQEYRTANCVVCNRTPCDPCHIKSKGSGGTDDDWNLISLCRIHHNAQHRVGIVTFYQSERLYRLELDEKGWYLNELGRLWNNKLNKQK